MNAKNLMKQAAYACVTQQYVEKVTLRDILARAEVSKQTFYRYYTDKYDLMNDIYAELTQEGIIEACKIKNGDDWRAMYLKQFGIFREHLDFIKHLYRSRETGCTTDFKIECTVRFDKEYLKQCGVDVTDPRIMFAIEAKDVGGTYMMRDWILGGMQVSDSEMVTRFQLIIPQLLVPYFT